MKQLAQINATTLPSMFGPAKFNNVGMFVNLLLPLLMLGGAIVFLIMLMYGAYSWITSGGEAKNMEKTQKIFTYAILGLLIIVMSYFAVKLIGTLLHIQTPL